MSKRTRSEADEPQSQINRSCQYKRTKEEPSPPLPIAHLHISVLRWDGEPIAWDADGNDTEEYAQYVYAIPPSSPLSAVAWSDEHAAWRYHPPPGNDIRFIYKRAMFIGTGDAALTWYGKIWGEADEQARNTIMVGPQK
ncbi:hypothetical protein EWM64_g3720 [Hericium alpestre]|uniref:Uncharacterized protein n=1 Tax=Hericium alpestre TaxID=135208 RepID=A0A4Y9ZZK0_9AGAM|nr:hypothetical protein EWM64_g3720 [Hericium alpestre]